MTDHRENVNWSRFGLDPVGRTESSPPRPHHDQSSELKASGSTSSGNPNVKDLFDEDQVKTAGIRAGTNEICRGCQFQHVRVRNSNYHFKNSLSIVTNKSVTKSKVLLYILKETKRHFL